MLNPFDLSGLKDISGSPSFQGGSATSGTATTGTLSTNLSTGEKIFNLGPNSGGMSTWLLIGVAAFFIFYEWKKKR